VILPPTLSVKDGHLHMGRHDLVALAGQYTSEVRTLWQGPATWVPKLLWYLLPNLGALNANESVIYRTPPPAQAWLAALYAFLYAGSVLALAALAFERRDLR